jgi:hypothetical protein
MRGASLPCLEIGKIRFSVCQLLWRNNVNMQMNMQSCSFQSVPNDTKVVRFAKRRVVSGVSCTERFYRVYCDHKPPKNSPHNPTHEVGGVYCDHKPPQKFHPRNFKKKP